MIGEIFKFFTIDIYVLLGIFTLIKYKQRWIYDSLYSLGMTVGLMGTLINYEKRFIKYYADLLDISENTAFFYSVLTHLLIVIFLFWYKPVLYGKTNPLYSILLSIFIVSFYLSLINPEKVYVYHSNKVLLPLSILIFIIVFLIKYKSYR
jgi:hypothetical protein